MAEYGVGDWAVLPGTGEPQDRLVLLIGESPDDRWRWVGLGMRHMDELLYNDDDLLRLATGDEEAEGDRRLAAWRDGLLKGMDKRRKA